MSITSKFVLAKTKAAFEREKQNIPVGLDPIVFIEDTKELWTKGIYFSMGFPTVSVNESNGKVTINIGDSFFTLQTIGTSLSINKGINNDIILSSNALSYINTEYPLEWVEDTKKLLHKKSSADAGIYGSDNQSNASSFYIPNITIDEYGHITNIKNSIVSIRDYVAQIAPTTVDVDRNILLSFNESSNNTDINQVRKASGLLYNDYTKILSISGGLVANNDITITSGDLKVINGLIIGDLQGNVSGEATPKIHLSENPEYGGASTELYGHVKLQKELNGVPAPPSNSADKNASDITNGIAASPYMVWKVKDELNTKIDSRTINGIKVNDSSLGIEVIAGQDVKIKTEGGLTGRIDIETGELIFSSVDIKAINKDNQEVSVRNNLNFTNDFLLENNNLSIYIEEII